MFIFKNPVVTHAKQYTMMTFYIEACDVQETKEDDRLIKGATRAGFTGQFSDTEANQEVVRGEPLLCASVRVFMCTSSVSKKPQCFSVIWRYCCAIFDRIKKEGRQECARTTCLHTCLRTHTRLADTSSVLFPSATEGYDTAKEKKKKKKPIQKGERMSRDCLSS